MAGAISIGLSLFHTLQRRQHLRDDMVVPIFIVKACETIVKPAKVITDKKEYPHLQYLSTRMLSTSELSLLQVNKEVWSTR